MSHQNDSPTQSALAADSAFEQTGTSPQSAPQAVPQGAGDSAHQGAQNAHHGHQQHQQHGQRSRDFASRRNSHSRAGSGPGGQFNNGYRPRGGGPGGHRYGATHSRGNSYHQNAGPALGPLGSMGPNGHMSMYAPAPATMNPPYYAYPGSYPVPAPGSPNGQPPLFYPPFQMQGSAVPRSRVSLSDASGNPIDIHAAVSVRHQHVPESRNVSETPSAHSRSSSVATPEASEAEATVKKATTGGSSAVESMKAFIAAKKKAKETEAAQAGKQTSSADSTEPKAQPAAAASQEQEQETASAPAKSAAPATESSSQTSREAEKPVASPTPETKPDAQELPESEPAVEPKSTAELQPTSESEQKAEVPAEEPVKAAPKSESASEPVASTQAIAQPASETQTESRAWKSPTVARLEAEKAQAEAGAATKVEESKTSEETVAGPVEPKDEAPAAPKKAAWKSPTVLRIEAEKAKAASEKQAQASGETETRGEGTKAESAEAPLSALEEEPSTEDSEAATEKTRPRSDEEKAEQEPKQSADDAKDSEEAELGRVQAFTERLTGASRPSPEDLEAHTYPSSVIPNGSFGSGERYRYTLDFLQQFESVVPRLNHASVRATVGFDFEFTTTGGGGRWGSGMAPRSASSRGPSRVGSFANFGRGLSRNASGAQSMRGRQGSRRRGDRQGSRRDRDDVTANGTPIADLPPLKKAENAWTPRFMQQKEQEVTDDGRLTPEEVQRKVKSLLNKMAWENFERISTEIREIALQSEKETTAITLRQIIQLTFEKAIDEPHWSAMYAQLFWFLHVDQPLPDTIEDHSDPEKVIKGVYVLRRYLLNMSQKEFEKGWNSIVETTQGAAVLSDEYYMAIAKKRRGLGLIQFVGELYKLSLISDRLLTSCFRRLMAEEPTEDIVESTSRLLKTVAPMILQKNGKQLLDMVMETMKNWRENGKLAARLRFMIMDVEDLARKNWEGVGQDGPKTIAQVHEEAVKREQAEQRERARRGAGGSRRGGDFGRPFAGGKRR